MKSIIVSLLAILLTFSFTSCEEIDDLLPDLPPQQDENTGSNDGNDNQDNNGDNNTYQISPDDLAANLESKAWMINLFIEDFDNETSDFEGYEFSFNANGSVVAQNGGTTSTGTWGTFADDGQTEFWMSFPNTGYFAELSDDWYLKINASDQIRLEGSNPSEDTLVFHPYE